MRYIDGFVIPVPASKKGDDRALALTAAAVFKEYGATRVVECWGADLPKGAVTDFMGAVKAEEAARFYTSLLPHSRIDTILRYTVKTPET